jgi:predicted  nucleic acid-binding Zn-ribbon protein
MKTKTTKLTGILLTLVMLVTILGVFTLSATAAEDLTVSIDTGTSITLKDNDGDGYYDIGTADEMYAFAALVNGGNTKIDGELTADITVNTAVLKADGTLNGDGSAFRVWTPIGGKGVSSYGGDFEGNGKTISGLYFNDPSVQYVGFIGNSYGSVQNLTIKDSYFSGSGRVGGIAGSLVGHVSNCVNYATVVGSGNYAGGIIGYSDATVQNSSFNGSVNGYSYVGGIVGTNKYQIVQCTSFGYVTGTYSNIGGVAGENSDDIISCTNYSTVTGTNSSSDYVGGITGNNSYASSVANCHNSGAVSGASIVGGLVGRNDSTVMNSYNTGNVNGKGMIGGVAGYNTGNYILSCYNTGTVNGTGSYVSSIVGDNESTISLCYYLDTCGASGTGTAKTAAQFASGEVAFLLGDAFGQDVTTGEGDTTVDALPVFAAADGSNKLYRYSTGVCTANAVYKYANEETADQRTHDTSLTAAEHYNANGTCKNCGTQAAASLTTADETPVVTYYMTLKDAITAAQGTDGSTITLLDDVQLSTALSITSNKFTINLNGHNVNAANGATLSNSGDLTITGSGSYNGKIENRGTMVINANVDGEINTYGEKLTVIGGTIQSLIVHGEDIVSLKGGTFDNLKVIVNNPGSGVNDDSALKCLNKLLANGKVYSHYSTNLDRYNSEGYIHFGDDVARFDAWFASPVSVLEDDPVIPTISTQPVGADYTVIDTAEALSVTATNNDDGGTLSYQWYSDTDDDAIGGIAITDATEATYTPPTNVVGTVYYYCVVTNSKTGFDSESTTSSVAKVTIAKATPTASDFASILPITPVYDGETEEIDVTTADGIVGMGQITVWYKDADRNRLTGLPTNAGTYYVYIDVAEGDNYEAITELEIGWFTIEKATPVLTAPTAIEDLIYNGEKLALVNAGSTTGGTLRYGVIAGEYNSGTIYGPVLEEAIPTATDAGSYIVFYMVEGGDNYEDVAMQHITVTIGKATPTITVSASLDKVMPGYVIDITGATDAVDNSLNPTTFTVVDGEGYSVSGNTITIDDGVKIGSTITVKMISTETKNFLAGEGTITLTIGVPSIDTSELEKKIEELEAKLDDLDATFATDAELKAEVDALKAELQELKDTDTKTAEDIKAIDEKIAALDSVYASKAEFLAAVARLDDLTKNGGTIEQINAEIKKINDALSALNAENRLDAAEASLDTLINTTIPAINALISDNAYDISANTADIAKLKNTLANVQQTLTKLSTEDVRLASLISTLETELDALSDSLDTLAGRVDTAEKDIAALKAELATKYAELRGLIESNSNDIASINDTLQDINSILGTLATQADVESEVGILTALIDDLTDRIEANEGNIGANINAISALQSTVRALQATVASQNEALEQSISSLSSTLSVLETRIAQNEQNISALNTDLKKAIEDLNKAIADGDKALADEIDALEKALDDAKAALEKADADNKAELISKIEAADAALDEAIKAVQKNLDDAKAELDKALDDKIAALEARCDGLQTFIIVVCIISAVALCGCVTLAVFFIVDKKKKI